jgi:gluconate 2-dehydrogenase gamma chain
MSETTHLRPAGNGGPTRRDVLRRLALTLTAAGTLDRVAAQEIHHMTAMAQAATGGAYAPVSLTPAQYRALERLTDLIIPVENGAPGAVAAGAAAWIDLISSENDKLKEIYRSGLAWLDGAMKTRGAGSFATATPAQQTELLDLIAYRRNLTANPELGPGIEFFSWVRRMTVDAFYTSAIGIKDIDYRGNSPMGSYPEPTESIAYVLKRTSL